MERRKRRSKKAVRRNPSVPRINRQYKSTVFAMLFHDRKNLLELYNAVNHSHYTKPEELEIVTLENAVYMSMKNDIAFIVDMRIHLYEHQSTYNPNMPLRNLFYVAKEYEGIVSKRSLYSSTLAQIPAPHFIVFYNGTEERPEQEELRLSDSFLTKEETPELELRTKVLNINEGKNRQLLEDCRTLQEYALFVETIRGHLRNKEKALEQAVRESVDECIDNGILKDFLLKNKAGVIAMSIFEYHEKEEKEKLRRAEYEGGYKDGIEQGIEQGREEGEEFLLRRQIEKRLKKGWTLNDIADDLSVSFERIKGIVEKYDFEK